MDDGNDLLDDASAFALRRAVERLREGLFDPLAVRLLTAHEDRLREAADAGFRAADAGEDAHLCLVGAYGRGKSHSLTYLQDYARKAGFVTSFVNLDPREVPFHRFRDVYRALLDRLVLPDTDDALPNVWRARAAGAVRREPGGVAALLPPEMPHLFRAVLAAMAQPTVSLSESRRKAKKHRWYRPRAFPSLLSRALAGERVPLNRLKHALRYRQVDFYADAPLTLREDEAYVEAVRGLATVFRGMGYRGWVLLFDEGEAVAQVPVTMRRKSYGLLHRLLLPETPAPGLFPVFAFTDDFFAQVAAEDYARREVDDETPYFDRNYAAAWRSLTRYDLEDLSADDWKRLAEKLVALHARAYGWTPPPAEARRALHARLAAHAGHETRYQLKALVDELDLLHQAQVL